MTNGELVSVREHIESRLAYEVKILDQRLEAQENWLQLKFGELQTALKIQSVETERRLVHLNNSQELAIREQSRTLPRIDFEAWLKEHDKWREDVQRSVQAIQNVERSMIDLRAKVDGFRSEYDAHKLEQAKTITSITTSTSTKSGTTASLFAGACLVVSILIALISLFWKS